MWDPSVLFGLSSFHIVGYSVWMRFLIATGIYPPEIGGPAYYAKNLAEALRQKGHVVDVATFGSLKELPTGIRHIGLFFKMMPMMIGADIVIALDTFSAALPAVCLAKLVFKPVIIRTGGDFIWEQYVDRTHDMLPLPVFYELHQPFSRKEKMLFAITKWLLKRSRHVVFSTNFQKNIWMPVYELSERHVQVIPNALLEKIEPVAAERKNFMVYGRNIAFQNRSKLREAIEIAKRTFPDIVLEEGQLPQHVLMEKIRHGYCVINPSVSDISPNLILDSIRAGKPFIMSKYSEFVSVYPDFGLYVDPLDVTDIAAKIVEMCHPKTYSRLTRNIAKRSMSRTYEQLADDFIALSKSL